MERSRTDYVISRSEITHDKIVFLRKVRYALYNVGVLNHFDAALRVWNRMQEPRLREIREL